MNKGQCAFYCSVILLTKTRISVCARSSVNTSVHNFMAIGTNRPPPLFKLY